MRLTPEKIAEWKSLVPKLNDDSDDHMDVAHSADMAPQHTVNFRHAKNAHEAAWAITNLIADLEEAKEQLASPYMDGYEAAKEEYRPQIIALEEQLANTRKQLAESERRYSESVGGFKRDLQQKLDDQRSKNVRLKAKIAEAQDLIEAYRKDAERFQELLSRLGDDSGLTIVKIEGWSDEYPSYAWFAALPQEQVIAELDTAIAAKGESEYPPLDNSHYKV